MLLQLTHTLFLDFILHLCRRQQKPNNLRVWVRANRMFYITACILPYYSMFNEKTHRYGDSFHLADEFEENLKLLNWCMTWRASKTRAFQAATCIYSQVWFTCKEANVRLAGLEGTSSLPHHLLPLLLQRWHLGQRWHKGFIQRADAKPTEKVDGNTSANMKNVFLFTPVNPRGRCSSQTNYTFRYDNQSMCVCLK